MTRSMFEVANEVEEFLNYHMLRAHTSYSTDEKATLVVHIDEPKISTTVYWDRVSMLTALLESVACYWAVEIGSDKRVSVYLSLDRPVIIAARICEAQARADGQADA